MNILITGSNGFIGKNLKKKLTVLEQINLYEFNRNDSLDVIVDVIDNIDFIFHLAGEVRPSSSDEAFNKSHGLLTQEIINIIEGKNLKIPILLTSSKHAENPSNMYGKSKKQTEDLVIEYSKRNQCAALIYRLSHVFGEGCKPNYNSVISTWIYNSINDLEIKIFDREIKMRYLYVQDIVENFIHTMQNFNQDEIFYDIEQYHDTTLGDVVDYLEEFKKNADNENYTIEDNNTFKKKLLIVYLDYVKHNG